MAVIQGLKLPDKVLSLYPEQQTLVERVAESLEAGRNPMISKRTGAGKTETLIGFLEQYPKYKNVAWITSRQTLYKDVVDRSSAYGISATSSWPIGSPFPRGYRVAVLGPTAARRRDMSDVDLYVLDEAHHFYTFIKDYPKGKPPMFVSEVLLPSKTPRVGMTATPWLMSPYGHFCDVFDELLETESFTELVDMGRLAPLKVVPVTEGQIKGIGTGADGDYDMSRTYDNRSNRRIATTGAVNLINPDKKTLVFAMSVTHAFRIAEMAAEAGHSVGILVSRNPKEVQQRLEGTNVVTDRDEVLNRFKDGDLMCLVNYSVISEGFDCPAAEELLITRVTKSLAFYRQMTGRVARVDEGKDFGIIRDLTDNEKRLGHPMSDDFFYLESHAESYTAGVWNPPDCIGRDDDGRKTVCDAKVRPNSQVCGLCKGVQGRKCSTCGKFRRWGLIEPNTNEDCWYCIEDQKVKARQVAKDRAIVEPVYNAEDNDVTQQDVEDVETPKEWLGILYGTDPEPEDLLRALFWVSERREPKTFEDWTGMYRWETTAGTTFWLNFRGNQKLTHGAMYKDGSKDRLRSRRVVFEADSLFRKGDYRMGAVHALRYIADLGMNNSISETDDDVIALDDHVTRMLNAYG